MRFIANGPSIPDELLLARDQGRVVFFCGAGVSHAKAQLPDFFELAEAVTDTLRVQKSDPAMKIIAEAREIGRRTGVDGLISADRIFGLLERSFLTSDIHEAVARALKLADSVDVSAHKTLLKLATTRENLVRLVTTNFDRLFDIAQPGLPTYISPNLPDPARATEFTGVVYLHGKINSANTGAEGDGFVLSSSEFGRAYLSDGWATTFVREILERYAVVFIGYSADDPPVQYLLEALNRTSGPIEEVYAFQAGDSNYANSRWQHKGVTAIAYEDANGHSALWDTLEAWAARAEDPDSWAKRLVERAKAGPENLQPHERGQIAHIVSTIEGARKFSEGDDVPAATWLCAFDPSRRYAKPGRQGSLREEGAFVDPFDLYSLDSDPTPKRVDPEDYHEKRDIPDGVWDAFALNKLDRNGVRDDHVAAARGYRSGDATALLPRQFQIGTWISRVADQPEAVWWAVRQLGMHPEIRNQIRWRLERDDPAISPVVRQAWRYLFDFWSENNGERHLDWYELAAEINKDGWSEAVLRRFALFGRPYLKVREDSWSGPVPDVKKEFALRDLVSLDVEYPALPENIAVPDIWLKRAVAVMRRNLETALELENEIGGYGLNICAITPDDDSGGDSYSRGHGLSGWVLRFIRHLNRLIEIDLSAAHTELSMWPRNDATIFSRLRIWALSQPSLVSDDRFGEFLDLLPDEAFWDSYHARDLLLTIRARWPGLRDDARGRIEERILRGREPWPNEEDDDFKKRNACEVLDRLHWLSDQGCPLQLDLDEITEALRKEAPNWNPLRASGAAQSLDGKSGWGRTETEPSALLDEPLDSTLSKAVELSGRRGSDFVEYDPFAGLSQEYPVRAFSALRLAAKKGEFPEWAWRTFLNPDRRKSDLPKFTIFIGEQVSRLPQNALATILRPVTDWIQKAANTLAAENPDLFSRLVSKTIDVLSLQPPESATGILRGNKVPDWTMEAINSPTGKLAESLFDDPRKNDLPRREGFPEQWLHLVERLLVLPGDLRRHALVIFSHNLSWFFFIDPAWTERNLLSVLRNGNAKDREAVWAGFLWGGRARGRELFAILKPHMLKMARAKSLERRGHLEVLTGLLLSAWALTDEENGEKWVTDEELCGVLLESGDDLRSQVLWQSERWANENPAEWSELLMALLRDVWPRQIAAKSGMVSARLCDIAFSDEKRFPKMAAIILPLLTKVDRGHLMLPNIRRSSDNIVDMYPRETLALLHAVLPDNVAAWPYGVDTTITRIGEADGALNSDERLIELRRKWDAR